MTPRPMATDATPYQPQAGPAAQMAEEPVQAERGPQDEECIRLSRLQHEQALDDAEEQETGHQADASTPEPPAEIVDGERASRRRPGVRAGARPSRGDPVARWVRATSHMKRGGLSGYGSAARWRISQEPSWTISRATPRNRSSSTPHGSLRPIPAPTSRRARPVRSRRWRRAPERTAMGPGQGYSPPHRAASAGRGPLSEPYASPRGARPNRGTKMRNERTKSAPNPRVIRRARRTSAAP